MIERLSLLWKTSLFNTIKRGKKF